MRDERRRRTEWIRDLVFMAGAACVLTGLYLAWPPAAWIAGGAGLGLAAVRSRSAPQRPGDTEN